MTSDEVGRGKRLHPLAFAGVLVFSLLFFKNAWVDEDAYITFRSIEQLFAGNGLRWNPHERVQAFTHPLWLFILCLFRLFTRDLFLAAILAAYGCCLASLLGLRLALGCWKKWALLVLLLASSKSFFDFTSSGLENPLAYALLSFFLLVFFRLQREPLAARPDELGWLSLLLGLLLVTRHDLCLLVAPAYLTALWQQRHGDPRKLAAMTLLGLAPFLLWTLFSLFYYGFPFPNTAYAKLATGIPSQRLWQQGAYYLESLWWDDPLAGVTILTALVSSFVRATPGSRAIGLGLALNALYVVKIGGDYMTGRFFACSYLVAALFLVSRWEIASRAWPALAAAAVIYAWLLPGSPITSGPAYHVERPNAYGVGDQRGILFPLSSIHRWLARDPDQPFPDYHWSRQGRELARSPERVALRANLGFMGYWAGTEKIIVDRLGLADPLLARLPSQRVWRIGHFPRKPPAGYLESLKSGESRIEDAAVRAYHDRLRSITQADLWSVERFETIVLMNLGHYDHLLKEQGRR